MKIAYIDAFSGVAGDMLLAALLDAGAPLEELLAGLRTISPISGEWNVELHRVTRGLGSIAAAHVTVTSKYQHRSAAPPSPLDGPHSDHNHTHSHDHSHSESHSHGHSHGHSHDHSHHHEEITTGDGVNETPGICQAGDDASSLQHDPLRNLNTISKMLRESDLPTVVKERSIAVFTALGEAEAKTHGSTLDKVHFHEVGAIDSIVDTVGVVYALHLLGVEKVFCSALPFSEGTVWTAHGILPVPAPATLRLMVKIPTCPGPKSANGELVTPTGAALVHVLASDFGRPPLFTPQAIGIGAGTKEFDKHPNILRVIVGDVLESPKALAPAPVEDIAAGTAGTEEKAWTTRQLWMLETNIDDMSGEVAGYLMEKLLAEGSLDAWVSPALMKKSRPAYTVHVLCEPQDQERFIRLLFVESTTLGVRRYPVDRCSLRREMVLSPTVFGDIPVKVAWLDNMPVNCKPEYEDCKVLAAAAGVPLQVVMDAARTAAEASIAKRMTEEKGPGASN